MMPLPEKSEVRLAIEADVMAALAANARPLSVDDLYPARESADDKATLARILSHMRNAGAIVEGGMIQPGEPGGMSGRGARAVKAWRLPADGERMPGPRPDPEVDQGKSADIIAVMRGQEPLGVRAGQADADSAREQALRDAYPEAVETFDRPAAPRMSAAEDDDAEARFDDELEWARGANSRAAAYPAEAVETFDRLDDAADSRNGDEFSSGPLPPASAWRENEPRASRPDPAMLADLRCSRCDAGMTEDRAALLLHGAEELLIIIARERLRGDPVWDLAHAHYQALMEAL